MTDQPGKPPFPRHRVYYLVLKIVVLILAVLLGLRLFTPFFGS